MGNTQEGGTGKHKNSSKHGIKQGTVLNARQAKDLGRKNVKLPKFIENNDPSPINMSMEKIRIPYEKDKDKWCVLIRNALTKKECQQLIKLSEKQKYGPAYVRTRDMKGQQLNLEGRNNSRVMIDSFEMAHFLFKRVEKYIPKYWKKRKVISFNERLRFLRYYGGEYFKLHMDGPYKRENGERSWCTVLIYLNEGFQGGSTILYDLNDYDNNKPLIPQTGMVLLFQHNIWHEGEELVKGKKYIIRSDIMYEANETQDDQKEQQQEEEQKDPGKDPDD